ncbi:hypothetical protein EJ069_32360 [Mesorhizobium sp. M2A.F.Ca.ET.043.05.1.1]|nr:hypothetical protein EJ069_32360 [Mesorhizobium sp. M2A.F.Ca.ET.043.05.1.1]
MPPSRPRGRPPKNDTLRDSLSGGTEEFYFGTFGKFDRH